MTDHNGLIWSGLQSCRLFWSGGVDSTVVLLSLLKQGIVVDPIWVAVNVPQKTMDMEREARRLIIHSLPQSLRSLLKQEAQFEFSRYYSEFVRLKQQLSASGIKTVSKIPQTATSGFIRWNHVAFVAVSKIVGPCLSGICQQQQISEMPQEREWAQSNGLLMPIVQWTRTDILDEAERLGILNLLGDTWSCPNPTDDGPCKKSTCIWCSDRILLGLRNG